MESKLKAPELKIDMLVHFGAIFCFDYLNTNNHREDILTNLNKLSFQEGTIYDIKKNELQNLLKSNSIKDMLRLWILINYLSGKPAIENHVLKKKVEYELNDYWIGKELIKHKFYYETIFNKNRNILNDFIIAHSKKDYSNTKSSYFPIYLTCNNFFESTNNELGHFFRTFHRTLKLINQYYFDDHEEYRMQIGLLRAQTPNSVAQILFYNAVYTDSGRGLGRELLSTNFFGNTTDFKFNLSSKQQLKIIKAQHFHEKSRFLSNQNAYICSKLFSKNSISEQAKGKVQYSSNYFFSNNKLEKNMHIINDFLTNEGFSNENKALFFQFNKHFEKNSISFQEPFKLFSFDNNNN